MKFDDLAEYEFGELLKMDGYDDCAIGLAYRFGHQEVIAYDLNKVLHKLQADGMTYDEAMEFYEYNMIGAYVGDATPIFVMPFEEDK